MAALPHDETRHEVHAEVDEPSASLAWRILTSPRTFGVLAATMAALLVVASLVPQRASVQELARALPFASASAVRDLGLGDVLVSWPFLLVVLLMVLNLAGLWLASRLGAAREKATAARGFVREGLVVVGVGVVTLLVALAVSRGSGLDGRLALIPGATTLPESTVRDGDLMLLRQLPLGLFCGRPDPQDPARGFPCRAAVSGGAPEAVTLTPGRSTSVGAFSLTPLREELRVPRDTDPIDLVIRRDGAIERVSVEPGTTVELKRGGERVTALPGPDGPLVVLQAMEDGKAVSASLLVPSASAVAAPLRIEVEHPTTVTLAATTSPEWPLVLAGLGLVVLGFLLAAFLRGSSGLGPAPHARWLPVRADLWTGVSLVLVGAGVALGLTASPSTPAVPLALGALIALGTRAAPLLAGVALVAGLGTAPDLATPGPYDVAAAVATGLALGVLGRWLATDEVLAKSPLVLAGLCALALGVLHLLPAPALELATAAGEPLVAGVTVADGASAMRVQWPVALFGAGRASTLAPLMWLGLAVAVALFALHQRQNDPNVSRVRLAAQVAAGFGALAVVAGLLGLVGLLGSGSTEAEALRGQLDLHANDASVLAAPATSWELRLWSRPFVDGLTVLLGIGLVSRVLPIARGDRPWAGLKPAPTHIQASQGEGAVNRAPTGQSGANVLVAAALLSLVGFWLAVAHGVAQSALLGVGAAVLAVGALVSQRDVRARLMPRLLVVGSAALSVAVWLAPAVT